MEHAHNAVTAAAPAFSSRPEDLAWFILLLPLLAAAGIAFFVRKNNTLLRRDLHRVGFRRVPAQRRPVLRLRPRPSGGGHDALLPGCMSATCT
jgi:hypothetical protein